MTSLLSQLNAIAPQAAPSPSLSIPKPKPKPKAAASLPPAPPLPSTPKYWKPLLLELHVGICRCDCGGEWPTTPNLLLREQCGTAVRLRAISHPANYSLLARETVFDSPQFVHTCPSCFEQSTWYSKQLPLFGLEHTEPLAIFHVSKASKIAADREARLEHIKSLRASFQESERAFL